MNPCRDINILVETSVSWGLNMNASKCVCVRFSPRASGADFEGISPYVINNQPINFVDSHTDLGVLVHRQLKFHIHVRNNAAMQRLEFSYQHIYLPHKAQDGILFLRLEPRICG